MNFSEFTQYLNQKYGNVKAVPGWILVIPGKVNNVPRRFKLPDGREITVDFIITNSDSGELIVDPEFDFDSLPD